MMYMYRDLLMCHQLFHINYMNQIFFRNPSQNCLPYFKHLINYMPPVLYFSSNSSIFSGYFRPFDSALRFTHLLNQTRIETPGSKIQNPSQTCLPYFKNLINYTPPASASPNNYSGFSCYFHAFDSTLRFMHLLTQTRTKTSFKIPSNSSLYRYTCISLYSSYSNNSPSRSLRRRISKRSKSNSKPSLDKAQFHKAVSQLPPRFTSEELCNVLTFQEDPLVCLELFNWASQQPRFRHDVSTYHITIKKLGAAELYQEMDDVVNQVLAVPYIGSEALYNTMIYFFTQARKLTRAVNIFKHMRSSRNLDSRPSIRTYNLLFAALLGRGSNSYINHMYMETIRCLFKQMVNDGIEPDIFALNSMIKGYVLSLHVNDALRIFHQMGTVYNSLPNSHSYDYLIHGLCAQGRTNNARELCNEMRTKRFVPSRKSYNSLVNALALGGEVEEAVSYLWDMTEKHRSADFITYRTVLDEICRCGRAGEAMRLLKELQEKDIVDGHTYRKLLCVLEDDFGSSNVRNEFR